MNKTLLVTGLDLYYTHNSKNKLLFSYANKSLSVVNQPSLAALLSNISCLDSIHIYTDLYNKEPQDYIAFLKEELEFH